MAASQRGTTGSSSNTDSDVESDSIPDVLPGPAEVSSEDRQITCNDEGAVAGFNVLLKSRTQHKKAVNRNALATNKTHNVEGNKVPDFSPFLPFFPKRLRNDNINILIFNDDGDVEDAKYLKDIIAQNVKFNKCQAPNVALFKDVFANHPFLDLDYALSKSQYIFLYMTNKFCNNYLKLSQSHACLVKILESKENNKAVIIVHTERDRKYQCPTSLANLRILNYFGELKKTFFPDVTILLDENIDLILEAEHTLMKEREKHLQENYDDIISKERFFRNPLKKLSVNEPVSKCNEKLQSTAAVDQVDANMQQMSLGYVSSVDNSSFAEQDRDVSGQNMNPHKICNRNTTGYMNKVASKTNCGSHPQPDGTKSVPNDLPSPMHNLI